ncbi:MAG: AI-2E family transporter [Ignavibacteria bacterium]|nr:AI-2E family transporter [Ignavibacteria bacterium]
MHTEKSDPVIKFFVTVAGVILIFAVMKELQHIFIPLVAAVFLYFVFEPFNRVLKKHKFPEWLAILCDLLIMVGFLYGISNLIVNQFSQLSEALPEYILRLNNIISSTAVSFGIHDKILTDFSITEYLNSLDYSGFAENIFSSTVSVFSSVFLVLFFFIFVTSGYDNIVFVIKNRYEVSTKKKEEKKDGFVEDTFRSISNQIQTYLGTKFLVSLLTAVLSGLALWIFGVDFVFVWIVITFLFNFIPNVGSIVAVILPALMSLVQFENFGYTLLIIIVISVIQNIIGNVIEPKIMGNKLGLNPIVILLSLLLWGYVWGITGMFLSVPLAGILKIILAQSDSKNMKFISNLMGN